MFCSRSVTLGRFFDSLFSVRLRGTRGKYDHGLTRNRCEVKRQYSNMERREEERTAQLDGRKHHRRDDRESFGQGQRIEADIRVAAELAAD
ncbi:hypothetical protein R1flu_027999 [Riccia fluitans]|uniref:Uncharacterized protein n=1 Tax=Riccia fluitans TaxID=41844 RepID=A0ABD1XKG8_9MARC